MSSHHIAIVDEDGENRSPMVLLSSKKKIVNDAEEAGSVIEYR